MQIAVRQISGLGNQLFQYAAGLYYAQRYQAALRVIIDQPQNAVSHGYARPFLLSQFCLSAPAAYPSTIDRLILSGHRSLKPAALALRAARGIRLFHEPFADRHTFLPNLPVSPGTRTLYLLGYFQNHRIAAAIEETLRKDLQFRNPPIGRNAELIAQIAQTRNPVSLHVRRGDYTLAVEGNIALPMDFYARAIAYFRERLDNPIFFVFSDDIPYTRANLPPDLPAVFIDHNDDASSHEDLRLMSACHHHILANSSFSWWGAWLNPRPDKQVFSPRYLHRPDSLSPDLFPPTWTLAAI